MLWAVGFQVRDVTGDGAPDLIVTTDAGGADAIATRGMIVYTASNGSIRQFHGLGMRGEGAIVHLKRITASSCRRANSAERRLPLTSPEQLPDGAV